MAHRLGTRIPNFLWSPLYVGLYMSW